MSKQRKHLTAADKVKVLRRHLVEKVPVSQVCGENRKSMMINGIKLEDGKYGLRAVVVTAWTKYTKKHPQSCLTVPQTLYARLPGYGQFRIAHGHYW